MMTEEQLIDRICLTCVDVRHAATDESAQKFINDIRGLAEQLAALTQTGDVTNMVEPTIPALKLPDGWVAVPLEPTEEMIAAGDRFMDGLSRLGDAYDAMLAASPAVPHAAPIEPICATGGAEWVKVSDRKPLETDGRRGCLTVLVSDGDSVGICDFMKGDAPKPWASFSSYGDVNGNDITHWMPLPAAPNT